MDQMVLGRVGHYHVPGPTGTGGTCQTAIVAHSREAVENSRPATVNLGGWEHDGETFRRLDVPVVKPDAAVGHSFHLTRDCPWAR